MDDSPTTEQRESKRPETLSETLGIVVVVILFIIGGVYFFITQVQTRQTPPAEQNPSA